MSDPDGGGAGVEARRGQVRLAAAELIGIPLLFLA
jgi:hypothetical protein